MNDAARVLQTVRRRHMRPDSSVFMLADAVLPGTSCAAAGGRLEAQRSALAGMAARDQGVLFASAAPVPHTALAAIHLVADVSDRALDLDEVARLAMIAYHLAITRYRQKDMFGQDITRYWNSARISK